MAVSIHPLNPNHVKSGVDEVGEPTAREQPTLGHL